MLFLSNEKILFLSKIRHLVVILGATASGKSKIATYLAQRLGTEIISADARQLYKGMKIATNAPSEEEMAQIQHHFIQTEDPLLPLSAGDYEKRCLPLIERLFCRHNTLILVGGSGLYVRAVCEGIGSELQVPQHIRNKWRKATTKGELSLLQQFVSTHEPEHYASIDSNNMHRLARAAEMIESSPRSLSELRAEGAEPRPFRVHKIALLVPRMKLYAGIEARCAHMLREGLWKEAESLYKRYGAQQIPPTIGYVEAFRHFEGDCSKEEAETHFVTRSRQYAKRQLTWLRKEKGILWFAATERETILSHVMRITQS